jgi:hypothetical protein
MRSINGQDFPVRSGKAAGHGSMIIQCADPGIYDEKIGSHFFDPSIKLIRDLAQ